MYIYYPSLVNQKRRKIDLRLKEEAPLSAPKAEILLKLFPEHLLRDVYKIKYHVGIKMTSFFYKLLRISCIICITSGFYTEGKSDPRPLTATTELTWGEGAGANILRSVATPDLGYGEGTTTRRFN